MNSSVHDKLSRVRKPRVHITYEVETEGAAIVRELPFVVGVLGDFAGDPTEPMKPAHRAEIRPDRQGQFQRRHVAHRTRAEPQGRQYAGR